MKLQFKELCSDGQERSAAVRCAVNGPEFECSKRKHAEGLLLSSDRGSARCRVAADVKMSRSKIMQGKER